jgi:type II secretory ATPase GspE/PulE/Tfp pilus assembly ATPase PilB-like protein
MPPTIDATLRQIARSTEEQVAQQLAQSHGLAYAVLDGYPFSLESLHLIPVESVQARSVAVYLHTATKARVAILHPDDKDLLRDLQQQAKTWKAELELTVVSQSSFHYLVSQYLQLLKQEAEFAVQQQRQTDHQGEEDYFRRVQSLADMQKEVGTATTTKLLDVMLAGALNEHASDIHLEPGENVLAVRFRIDGILSRVLEIPMAQHHGLVSRIKVLANLKLDNQGAGQDGRFSLGDRGIQADIRVATIPTGYGEGIVMRILRHDNQLLTLAQLGFTDKDRLIIEQVIRRPYGLILVTGPTGSGKSTTLYSLLQILNTPERKIITLEDPIEYRLPGLQQSQIDPEKGFGFAEGLKSVLRQDPDVVMVGEIRDGDTAAIALNASLTGHLVLATLHTNDAVTAPMRLLEMGIEPYLLTGSIQLIVAQRLVRRLAADGSGRFGGRLVIGEILVPNPDFEAAVAKRTDRVSLEKIAREGGMVTMGEDGLAKVKAGLTTEAEIVRVTEV